MKFICFLKFSWFSYYPAGIYLLKVYNRNTKTRCEICSNLTVKTPERRQNDVIGVVLVSFLLTLNIFQTLSSVSIVDFEHVIFWVYRHTQSLHGDEKLTQEILFERLFIDALPFKNFLIIKTIKILSFLC